MGPYEPIGLQTIETSEGSDMRKETEHPSAQLFRWWVLVYWFSWTEQLSAVGCLHSWAQGKTRWQLLYLSPF